MTRRKGKASDIPEDHVPPEPPALIDHYAEKLAQFRAALVIDKTTILKWGQKDTPERRAWILFVLRCGHTFKMACEVAGISRDTLDTWRFDRKKDGQITEFGKQCEEAYEEGTDTHEEEFLRRAKDGMLRPVYQGGVLVGHERVFSDSLMQMLMQGRRSRVYGKQKVEHSGVDGAPVAHTHKIEIEFVKPKKREDDNA